MKKLLAAAAVAVLFAAPASANETEAHCKAYVAENGGDDSGCACLGKAAAKDPALAAALAAIQAPADLEAASDSTRAAIAACFPDA